MQLLERCEELNVIRGNYTQWCEHALDGAYEWMDSMDDASLHDYFHAEAVSEDIPPLSLMDVDPTDVVTEDQLLRKLMSEDGNRNTVPLPKITQKLPPLPTNEDTDTDGFNFPVEIEEPETELIESEINITAEQIATGQEDTQADEQTAYIEELFPIEIEESVSDVQEETEPEVLTYPDTSTTSEAQHADDSQVADEQAMADPEVEREPESISDEPLLLIDQPVIEQPNDAESVAVEATTTLNESVLSVEQLEDVEPVDINEPAYSVEQPEDVDLGEINEPVLSVEQPEDVDLGEINEHVPSVEQPEDIDPGEINEPAPSVERPTDVESVGIEATTLDHDSNDNATSTDIPVESASLPTETSHTEEHPELIPDPTDGHVLSQASDDIPETVKDTMAAEATDNVEKNEDNPPAQWPFVYQEVEETPLASAPQDEDSSQESRSEDAEQLSVDQAQKKPQDEAFSESSTKKQSSLGHWLTGFLKH
jgi:hypothetical protein